MTKKFFLLYLFSALNISNVFGQNVFQNFKELDQIHNFYNKYSELYARDFFRNYEAGATLNTFGGTQILYSGAWSLELRLGRSMKLPSYFYTREYSELYSYNKNIQFIDNKPYTKNDGELGSPNGVHDVRPMKLCFTLNDSQGNPYNSTKNGRDSIQWFIPSLTDLGINENVQPKYQYQLHWAPGYGFEFAGSFLINSVEETNPSGIPTSQRTKYYNIYFAHDLLYWSGKLRTFGWHFTVSAELTNITQSIALNIPSVNFFQNYQTPYENVWFKRNFSRIDFFTRTMRYGANFGRSFKHVEVWGGAHFLITRGGISDDGFMTAYVDDKPNDPTNGVRVKRYRGFLFSGINEYRDWAFVGGACLGQRTFRLSGQYSILTTGYHQFSMGIKFVFRDNLRHTWQRGYKEEEYFDPTKRKRVHKTVIIEREETDD